MFLVDTEHGRIVSDEEIKSSLAAAKPYAEWLHAGLIRLKDLPEREHIVHTAASVQRRQQTFGYTAEDLRILLTPMAQVGCRGARLDGHRHARSPCCRRARGCSSTTSPSSSRR